MYVCTVCSGKMVDRLCQTALMSYRECVLMVLWTGVALRFSIPEIGFKSTSALARINWLRDLSMNE